MNTRAKDAAFLLTLPDLDIEELTNYDRQTWNAALAWYTRYIEKDNEIISGTELTKMKPTTLSKVHKALREAKK